MTSASARERGLALGASRFLFRPLEPMELLAEVEACLGASRRAVPNKTRIAE
jgi:DNA-binding response OmpR family regulator